MESGASGPGLSTVGGLDHLTAQLTAHRFDLLGSGPVTIDYAMEAAGFLEHRYEMAPGLEAETAQLVRMRAALEEAARFTGDDSPALAAMRNALALAYRPIDWHRDCKSGYRWDAGTWYMDIPYGRLPGVDVKVPWELSRCHHLVTLALKGLVRPTGNGAAAEIYIQILDWIVANPPRFGVNWRSAMDVAIRAANWVWALALLPPESTPPALRWIIAKSLYQHARHLETHLDYSREVTGNHYLADIVGLMYVAFACPEFPESPRWLAFCLQELVSEMRRTVYADGVNHEASTGYHRLVTEMFLHGTLLALRLPPEDREGISRCSVAEHNVAPRLRPAGDWEFSFSEPRIFPNWYWKRLHDMVQYVADLNKPNGLVPQWGDQDSGRFVKLSPVLKCGTEVDGPVEEPRDHRHLLAVGGAVFGRQDWTQLGRPYQVDAHVLTSGVVALPIDVDGGDTESSQCGRDGLAEQYGHSEREAQRISSSRQEVVWYPLGGTCVLQRGSFWVGVRCERAGQHGRGGHEHNDRLSFELNIAGQDIIVDWGTGVYTADPEMRNRFRSTDNHSTVAVEGMEQNPWVPGPRGLFTLKERCDARCLQVEAGKFIGQHTGFGSVHRRVVSMDEEGLLIEDMLEMGKPSVTVLTLAPEVTPSLDTDNGRVLLRLASLTLSVEPAPRGRPIHIVSGLCSEAYGVFKQSHKVVIGRVSQSDSLRLQLLLGGDRTS